MSENLRKVNEGQVEALEHLSSKMESQIDTRRRFIKRAIATAPVILTVTAGPVWAKVRNCTPSGRLSGNLSKVSGPPCCGCSPGYWKNIKKHPWPIDEDTPWVDIFGAIDGFSALDTHTLIGVLNNEPRIPGRVYEQFGRHAVAAYLNSLAASGVWDCNYGYGPDRVRDMVTRAYVSNDDSKMELLKDTLEYLNTANEDMC